MAFKSSSMSKVHLHHYFLLYLSVYRCLVTKVDNLVSRWRSGQGGDFDTVAAALSWVRTPVLANKLYRYCSTRALKALFTFLAQTCSLCGKVRHKEGNL